MASGPNLDDAFFPLLWNFSQSVNVPPEWFLIILYEESGLRPDTHNAGSNYWGLNQMNTAWLRAHGIDPNDYLTWLASAQLQKVVIPFYSDGIRNYLRGTAKSAGALYALNLLPGMVLRRGSSPGTVLASKNAATAVERGYYDSNANHGNKNSQGHCGLDFDCEGAITIRGLDRFLANKMKEPPFLAELSRLYSYRPANVPAINPSTEMPPPFETGIPMRVAALAASGALLAFIAISLHKKKTLVYGKR